MPDISLGETIKRSTLALRHTMSPFFTTKGNSSLIRTDRARLSSSWTILNLPSRTSLNVLTLTFVSRPSSLFCDNSSYCTLRSTLLMTLWIFLFIFLEETKAAMGSFSTTSCIMRALCRSAEIRTRFHASLWYFIFKCTEEAITSNSARNNLQRIPL